MNIYKYVIKRILQSIPIVLGISALIFILFNIVSGDPAVVLLGKHAKPNQVISLRHELGLDKSLWLQYKDFLKSLLTLDLGRSWKSNQLISSMLLKGAMNSLLITVPMFILINLISIVIALFLAFRRNSKIDKIIVTTSIAMMSISGLAYIIFGQWVLAYKLNLFEICGFEPGFPHFIPYITLPVIVGVFLSLGSEVRYYRSIIIDEVNEEYVRTAIAKGLSNKKILYKHILKNAMIPILSNAIQEIPFLIFSGIFIEKYFSIPGFGMIIMNAVDNTDFPVIRSATIIISLLIVTFNIVTDVLSNTLDPRIRLE